MFENVIAGWKLAASIRKLVFKDRGLFIYPIVSGLVIFVETILILIPFLFLSNNNSIAFIVGLFIYYVIIYFTSIFIVVSMLLAFKSFEKGKKIGFFEALGQTASGYALVILEWAVFEAIVTMVIKALESRGRGGINLTALLAGLGISIAMSVIQVFAIPVIIEKKTGPIATIKESVGFITRNFGQTFGGLLFTDLYSILFIVAGIVVIILAIGLIVLTGSFILMAIVGIMGLLLIVYGAMLNYMLANVYKLILYDSATGGKLPEGITKEMVQSGIKKPAQAPNPPSQPGIQ
ncbi:MAG: hypothetical protein KGH72_01345 [Candidatus Micrarchaeota archaeon]|nr:hypothetical protein [Candidatus Micrarchaeota archaeon]